MKLSSSAVLMLPLIVACGSTPDAVEVSELTDEILTTSPGGFVRFGPYFFEFSKFVMEPSPTVGDDSMSVVAQLGTSDNYLIVPLVDGQPSEGVQLVYEKSIMEVSNATFVSIGAEAVRIRGRMDRGVPLLAELHMSAGSSVFRLDGDNAFLNGELGSGTYRQLEYLLAAHPEVETIVFENVPGSVNDDVNVYSGRLIRKAGLKTVVSADGIIASGGVGLFCAGVERTIEPGARIGVHAWSIPGEEVDPAALPRNHHAHRSQLTYFREMLDQGEEFYFFTLDAAPFETVHWMSGDEIDEFGLVKGSDISD